MELLKIENLTFSYPNTLSPTIKGVNLTVNEGEFTVLCGATGSGKSTLLRLLKRELSPTGDISGSIYYKETNITELSSDISASKIGFVMQNPEHQIVTDKVWHELGFGLENMGLPQNEIALRVCEMASYFGIESWFEKSVSELSGGQKQLLNLASVMAMQPDILILDEPTAQLDPIAATDFINTLKKLNTDFSLTVIVVEHRLEEVIPICDNLIVLKDGILTHKGNPRRVIEQLKADDDILSAMPSSVRLYHSLRGKGSCPLTVREGRRFLQDNFGNKITSLPDEKYLHNKNAVLEFKEVFFRYERNLPDVLKGINLSVYENEVFCILGGNGSGKTTTLNTAAGLIKAYSGSVKVFGKKIKEYKNQTLYKECLSMLPQDVETVFLKNTVNEELSGVDTEELPFDISHLLDKHPYDLSGGEQQLVALAKVLAAKPKLLLMDEPTKGLDAMKKAQIINILKQLKQRKVTVVIVTHDVEFAAECADRCALFFRGNIVSVERPCEFFSNNRFYTTSASRMSRGFYEKAVTVEQIETLAGLNSEVKNADD
ncbi:MAG: ATP-binding cassette domain-containing protein [Acutalibacteraceae bacterium]|nr:ATP-binding cassette domain-containing protein [Acutalibacteraceae bacterium]